MPRVTVDLATYSPADDRRPAAVFSDLPAAKHLV